MRTRGHGTKLAAHTFDRNRYMDPGRTLALVPLGFGGLFHSPLEDIDPGMAVLPETVCHFCMCPHNKSPTSLGL